MKDWLSSSANSRLATMPHSQELATALDAALFLLSVLLIFTRPV
jgi:hypothetical protein